MISMTCLPVLALARSGSRAATDATMTPGIVRAGEITARGAILAAPRMPIRNAS
jgi:hypothetical protein